MKSLFMQGPITAVSLSDNRLIGALRFCPVPLWPPTFGRVPTGQFLLCPPPPQADILASKRWIVDRAALKQARAEDMRYVKDPLFFDLFNIFTGNRTASPRIPPHRAEHRTNAPQ